jgi:hypothetical protein
MMAGNRSTVAASIVHLFPILTDRGLSGQAAARISAVFAALGLPSALSTGLLFELRCCINLSRLLKRPAGNQFRSASRRILLKSETSISPPRRSSDISA